MHNLITGGAGFIGNLPAAGQIFRRLRVGSSSHATARSTCGVSDMTYRMTGLSRRVVV